MITTKVILDHHNRSRTKKEPVQLEIRVTIDRKAIYIPTGIRVTPDQWLFDQIDNRPDAEALNERLGVILRAAYREVNECIEENRPINATDIKKRIFDTHSDDGVLAWLHEQIVALDVAEGTRKHYVTLERRLAQWGKILKWRDCDIQHIYDFDAWLHSLKRKPSNIDIALNAEVPLLSAAAVHNYHKCFRYLLSRAERVGKIASNPYNALRGEFKSGEKENTEYLTEKEMAAFESLCPIPGTKMALAKDLFVFQMYTGLAYSDAMNFDGTKYKKVNGKWQMVGERVKTGVAYVNQLLPPAVEVLEKYQWRIPYIDNSDYNKCLRALGMAAGIATRLHSHLARHTFATFMLRNGVKIENLSKMLGHTNISRTQRYAKVLAESVHEDFDMIEEIIKKR